MTRILLVDDEKSIREVYEIFLRRHGFDVVTAANLSEAREALRTTTPELVISDLKLGGESGLELLDLVKRDHPDIEVVMMTAFSTVETAVQALQRGAIHYLTKPIKNDELEAVCRKAVERRALVAEKRALSEDNEKLRQRIVRGELLGESPAIDEVRRLITRVAPGRTTVLVEGESGTGKEVVARLLHLSSGRKGAFVAMNCGAIPAELVESELFGHVKGAFTHAQTSAVGLFRAAHNGTLFLDEVGELPLPAQVKLLRVLQEREVRPVGGTSSVAVDVRVVAATNRQLDAEVRAGRFREDLFYRLNVVQLRMPPLRERASDVILLAQHFVRRFGEEQARPTLEFTPEAIELVGRYAFPGNVRELENLVERAIALSEGDQIGIEGFPQRIRHPNLARPATAAPIAATTGEFPDGGLDLEAVLESAERRYLQQALHQARGVQTRAAGLLRLSFRSFRYRLAKLGIRPDSDSNGEGTLSPDGSGGAAGPMEGGEGGESDPRSPRG